MIRGFLAGIIKKINPPVVVVKQSFIGFVDELNGSYACGWVCDQESPHKRLVCEAVLLDTQEVVASVIADDIHYETIKQIGDGSCRYAFFAKFSRILTQKEQAQLTVRVKDTDYTIPFAPNLKTDFQPFLHMAMDIVNNCNLRCPFCLYDYSSVKKTFFMDEKTIESALRFLPFIPDGEFWFSCLHEPTLHPQFMDFINKAPQEYRKKIFFTSNFAKKLPSEFFEWLVNSGIHHVNVSLESFDRETYEKLRKGARQHIFIENMEKLQQAIQNCDAPIEIRYIIMAYKSNIQELPGLFQKLMSDYRASLVEIRSSFDTPFIASDFRENEFLKENDWLWLEDQFKSLPNGDRAVILRELTTEESDSDDLKGNMLNGRYMLRLSWDGHLKVFTYIYSEALKRKVEKNLFETNINDISDVNVFYEKLIQLDNDTAKSS